MGSPWRPNCTHSRGGGPEGVERTSRDLEGAIVYHHFLSDQGPMVSKTICRHVCPESACHCRRLRRHGFNPWVRKIPWRRKWQPTPVFLPGESYRQRSLVGCNPGGHKESDTTEQVTLSFSLYVHILNIYLFASSIR